MWANYLILTFYQRISTAKYSSACIIGVFKVKRLDKYGAKMGIHYTYKSIRGEKAMKKEAKRKARLEQRRAKKIPKPEKTESDKMHDIKKTITLEDLTNPDKN